MVCLIGAQAPRHSLVGENSVQRPDARGTKSKPSRDAVSLGTSAPLFNWHGELSLASCAPRV